MPHFALAAAFLAAALAGGAARADEPAQFGPEAVALGAACEAGKTSACIHLGILQRHGVDAPLDPRAALERFVDACEKGVALACAFTGDMAYLGSGAAADPEHGVTLMRNACRRGNEWACETLRRHGLMRRDQKALY